MQRRDFEVWGGPIADRPTDGKDLTTRRRIASSDLSAEGGKNNVFRKNGILVRHSEKDAAYDGWPSRIWAC